MSIRSISLHRWPPYLLVFLDEQTKAGVGFTEQVMEAMELLYQRKQGMASWEDRMEAKVDSLQESVRELLDAQKREGR